MSKPEPIVYPNVNAVAVCNCGTTAFRVGLETDQAGNNRIRCLECETCGDKLSVPFLSQDKSPATGDNERECWVVMFDDSCGFSPITCTDEQEARELATRFKRDGRTIHSITRHTAKQGEGL